MAKIQKKKNIQICSLTSSRLSPHPTHLFFPFLSFHLLSFFLFFSIIMAEGGEFEPSWNEKTTESKNEFFLDVAKRNNIKIETSNDGRALRKTKSQSHLTQSTASLIGVSGTDLSLLTAQLGSVCVFFFILFFFFLIVFVFHFFFFFFFFFFFHFFIFFIFFQKLFHCPIITILSWFRFFVLFLFLSKRKLKTLLLSGWSTQTTIFHPKCFQC